MGKKGKKGKGKGKKKGKGKAVGPPVSVLLDNYRYACSILGYDPDKQFVDELEQLVAEGGHLTKIAFGERELNPLGMRCIIEGILGNMLPIGLDQQDSGMSGETYLNVGEIQIWKSNVGNGGLVAISKMLRVVHDKSFRLTVLDLMDNNISERGCVWLGQALAEGANTTLKTLSLDHNHDIGDAGVKALCDGLRTNQTLQVLGLEFCGMGPHGARSIAQAIFSPTCAIQTLRLMGNKIHIHGLVSLGMALKRNSSIQILDIGDNEIGDYPCTDTDRHGLESFIACTAENQALKAINLDLNFIGSSGYDILDDEQRSRMHPALTKSLVYAAGMAPETVEGATAGDGQSKKKKKGKGKKKKKKK